MVAGLVSGPEEFKSSVIPAATKIFRSLINPSEVPDELTQKDKVKRQVCPMIMCLQVEKSIFKELMDSYSLLPFTAKEFIKTQLNRILRIVLYTKSEKDKPDDKATHDELLYLYSKMREDPTEQAKVRDYAEVIHLYKVFVRDHGQESTKNLSKVLHQVISNYKDVEFLIQSCTELSMLHLIGLLSDLNYEGLISEATVRAISNKTKICVFDLIMETIFYPEQEKWQQLHLLQEKLFYMEPLADLTSGSIGRTMINQLNKLMPNRTTPGKVARPIPVLFMPFFLTLIVRMSRELGNPRPWSTFPNVIPLLISTKKYIEPEVWDGFIRFCRLDPDYFRTDIRPKIHPECLEQVTNELI